MTTISWVTHLAVGLLIAAVAFGQPATSAEGDSPGPAARLLADAMEQRARAALSGPINPTDAMITRARVLMEHALELDPTDPERWLLLAEAQDADDAWQELIPTLQAYLRLRPADDVVQLRLVDLLARKQQTAEKRLAFYTRIVRGPASDRFGPALRSRVAVRAARLAWERGEHEAHDQLLAEALSLDSTNKQAAIESLRRLGDDPRTSMADRAAGLFTLFHADPVDISTHVTIADAHMGLGHYAGALTWYESAESLREADRIPPSLTLAHSRVLALWGLGRDAEALALLDEVMGDANTPTADTDNADADAATDANAPAVPEDWPPIDTLMLNAAIRGWAGGGGKTSEAFDRLADRLRADAHDATDRMGPLTTLAWAHLICDQRIDAVADILAELETAAGGERVRQIMSGWLAMRQGRMAEAAAALAGHVDDDPRARLGAALVAEAQGDLPTARRQLHAVHRSTPDELFGLLAAGRLRRLGQTPKPLDEAARLAALFERVPADLRDMAAEPLRVVQVRPNVPDQRSDYGRPIWVTLVLSNASEWTLSLGPEGTIPTRVVLSPSLRAVGAEVPPAPAVVLDLYRRLRLKPREALEVPIRLDSGEVGAVMHAYAWPRLQLGCLGVLNPKLQPSGRFTAALLGSSFRVPTIVRRPTPTTEDNIEALMTQTTDPNAAVAMRAMSRLMSMARHFDRAEEADRATRIADRVNARFDELSPMAQAWSVAFANAPAVVAEPNAEVAPTTDLFQPMRDAAGRSGDRHVRLALLTTVTDPNSPYLNAALRGSAVPEAVQRFARATRQALRELAEYEAASEQRAEQMEAELQPAAPSGDAAGPTAPRDLDGRADPPPVPADLRQDANDAGLGGLRFGE